MMNSLAKRLTYRIMAVVLVMMAIISIVTYYSVRSYMLEEAQERYQGVLQRDHEEFRRRLSDVMVATKNNLHEIELNVDHPEKIVPQLERVLQANPSIITCAILYESGYFPERKRCLEIYSTRDSVGKVHTFQDEDDHNPYLDREWFKKGLSKDTADWSEAYFEYELIPNDNARYLLTTYSIPVHDQHGRPVALFGSDLSLEFLREELMDDLRELNEKNEKGSSRHSYNFVIDHQGTYIVHPDEERILNANFFEESKQTSSRIDDDVVDRMVKGETGSAMVEIDGVPSWMYYRPVKHMDWVIAIVVPEEVIFHKGRMLNTLIMLIVLLALLIIYLICRRMISDITTPVTVQKATLERELKIANGIQMAMLPKTFPPYPDRTDIDIYASVTPARDVGGDLYDYYLRDNRLFFCIGDVSGKGMPAALLMAVMRAMFRSETRRAESAAALVDTMNRNLSEEYTGGYFVTMFVGILDLTTGHLDYCNAGHEAPVIAGQPLFVKPNLPVGALPDWEYEGQQVQLKSGDMMFIYTDGLSEAHNHDDQLFGRKQVLRIAEAHRDDTAQQLVQTMEAEVKRHTGDAPQSDDITLLAIKWQNHGLMLRATMDEIGCLQPYIERVAQEAGFDSKESKRLRLAVEEAVANVINYAQASMITLHTTIADGQLVLTIDDDGNPFDPTKGSDTDLSVTPDKRPPGGMGIILMQRMTDGITYQRSDGHNILTLKKLVK
jgi:anti-sigma regulatory factor (Ser/Thr protein kinase)